MRIKDISVDEELEQKLKAYYIDNDVTHIVTNPKKRERFKQLWEVIDYGLERKLIVLDSQFDEIFAENSELKNFVGYKLTTKGKEYFGLYSEVN